MDVDRLEATGLAVEVAQIVVHEGDEPKMVVDLLHALLLQGVGRRAWWLLA
jgi:hypothetical protein